MNPNSKTAAATASVPSSGNRFRVKTLIAFLAFWLLSASLWAQIHTNNCSSATAGWTFTNTGSQPIQQTGNGGYWLLETGDIIISQAFDVSSYTGGLSLTFDVGTYNSGTNHPCLVEYSTDNGVTWSTNTFTSNTPTSATYVSSTFTIAASASTQFKFRFTKVGTGGKDVRLDNILFEGTVLPCTAPATQASAITFSTVTSNSFSVNWTNGDGAGRVVKMNTTNSFTAPASGSNPAASTVYTGGEQVIFNGTGSGPVTVTGLAPNTTYWVRVYEFCNPDHVYQTATATDNPNSVQTLPPPPAITTTAASFGPFCNGTNQSLSIAYTTTGTFTGTFSAQLSDATGSFATPTVIGSGASPISATIPAGTAPGTGYRVRVVNDNPVTNGSDNGSNITITATPGVPNSVTPPAVCAGNSLSIVGAGSTNATSYTFWTQNTGGNAVTPSTTPAGTVTAGTLVTPASMPAGTYTYYVQGENGGCVSARQAVTVTVNAMPVVNLGNDTGYCAGNTFALTLDAGNPGATYDWNSGAANTQTFAVTGAGTYSVTVTANGCSASDQITVTEAPVPTVNLGNDTAYCSATGINLTLDAGNPGATYNWNSGAATTQTLNVTGPGTYSVTVSVFGCTANDQVVVTENLSPVVNLGNDTGYCAGNTFALTLDAGNPGAIYNWNSGAATTQTFAVTGAGTYSVTVTANGCSASDQMTVTEMPAPTVALGNDTAYCAGTTFNLVLDAGNPGATYSWNGGAATTQTFTVTGAGTYSVTVDVFGCTDNDQIVVTENPAPVVNLGNDTAYCAGTAFNLTLDAGNPGATYDWNNGTATTQTFAVTGAGTYSVTVTANGCSTSDQIVVTENALPVVNLGNDTAYCAGTAFNLTLDAGNAGATYDWNSGAATTQTFAVTAAGTYSVNVTLNGCTGSDQITVTENAVPTVNLGNDTAYCAGTTFNLTLDAGNPGATYDWNNGAATTQTFAVTAAGTYSVDVTLNGCTGSDQITVTENTLPVVALGNDTAYCAGTAFNLTLDAGNPGATYDWNSGAATTQTFAVTAAGTYAVTVTGTNGCENSDQITVTENTVPTVSLGNDTAYCAGTTFNLTLDAGNPGATYNWNSGAATTQTFAVTAAGTYSVTVTNPTGCIGTDQLTVTENVSPIVNLGNDTAYCVGATFSVTLDAGNPGATYSWNNGIGVNQTFNVPGAGTYSVVVTGTNGCQGSDQIVIGTHPVPVVNLGNDTAFCTGSGFSLLLNAGNPGATYDWNNGAANTQTFTVTQAGIYSLTVTSAAGCSATDYLVVSENSLPVVNLGNDVSYCNGNTFTLVLNAGNPGSNYNWNSGAATTQTYTVTGPGTYSVTVTTPQGCQASDQLTVTQHASPSVDLGNNTQFCSGTPFSLTLDAGNPGATYNWNNGAATTRTFTVTHGGTYSVTVTDANGCTANDQVVVTEIQTPLIDLGPDVITLQDSYILDAGSGVGFTYLWQPGGQTTQQITVTTPGTYIVTVTAPGGCSASDTVTVTFANASVEEYAQGTEISVYPNPASERLVVKSDFQGSLQLNLVSINGRSVWSQKVTTFEKQQALEIDLTPFAAGSYILRVSGAGFDSHKVVIIQK